MNIIKLLYPLQIFSEDNTAISMNAVNFEDTKTPGVLEILKFH